jgi:hypothetical protein
LLASIVPKDRSGQLVYPVTNTELDALRRLYDAIARAYPSKTDRFIAFACGGIVMLNHVVARFCENHFNSRMPTRPEQAHACKQKFHLLPSLSWESWELVEDKKALKNREDNFKSWLQLNGNVSHMTIADTTFSGKAIRTVENVLKEYASTDGPLPRHIELIGIQDANTKSTVAGRNHMTVLRRESPVCMLNVSYLHVGRLVSEDTAQLIGYERISRSVTVTPIKGKRVLIIRLNQTQAIVLPTDKVATVFADVLLDFQTGVHGAPATEMGEFQVGLYKKHYNILENWQRNLDRTARRLQERQKRSASGTTTSR